MIIASWIQQKEMYSSTHKETSAAIWTLKYFKDINHGYKILVKADHTAVVDWNIRLQTRQANFLSCNWQRFSGIIRLFTGKVKYSGRFSFLCLHSCPPRDATQGWSRTTTWLIVRSCYLLLGVRRWHTTYQADSTLAGVNTSKQSISQGHISNIEM